MFNHNLILKIASDLDLSIKSNSSLNEIIKKIKKFKPTKVNNVPILSDSETSLLNTTQSDLNKLKKVRMIIQILRLGVKISNTEDMKELKERKIESLIDIEPSNLSKIQEILIAINIKTEFLINLKNKDNKIIVEEYNLMPPTSLLILFFTFLIFVSMIFSYIGFSSFFLKEKYEFLSETFAFWVMFLGGLTFLISINYLYQNIIIKIKQVKFKDKIIEELATTFIQRREKYINKSLLKLNKKKFEIDKKSIKEASILKLKENLVEEKTLLISLSENFS